MKGIDYSKLRSITAREIISTLIKDGFSLERQSGSHQQYYHQDGRRVTVANNRLFKNTGGDLFPSSVVARHSSLLSLRGAIATKQSRCDDGSLKRF
jgi:predicted RNA binding protein YcfA (HicA-like mRNA interferase family)